MVASGMSPTLLRKLAAGEYVVDEQAVAEAIIRRSRELAGAPVISRVLVSAEVFEELLGPPAEGEPSAGGDAA